MLAFGRLIIPKMAVARSRDPFYNFARPYIFLEWMKIESSNFVQGLAREVLVLCRQTIPQVGVVKFT